MEMREFFFWKGTVDLSSLRVVAWSIYYSAEGKVNLSSLEAVYGYVSITVVGSIDAMHALSQCRNFDSFKASSLFHLVICDASIASSEVHYQSLTFCGGLFIEGGYVGSISLPRLQSVGNLYVSS